MILVGKKVKHKRFGIGTVVERDDNKLLVNFGSEVKQFVYPDAFETYLKAIDDNLQDVLLDEIGEKRKKQDNPSKTKQKNTGYSTPIKRKQTKEQVTDDEEVPDAFTVDNLAILGVLDDFYEVYKSFSAKTIWVISVLFTFWKYGSAALSVSTIQTVYYDICNNIDNLVKKTIRIQIDDSDSLLTNSEALYIFDRLSSTRCWNNHQVLPKKYVASVIDGPKKIILPVHYCCDCNRYLIGKRTLSLYEKNYGKMFLERKNISDRNDSFALFSAESYLHQMGYNVIDGEMTDEQRQNLLTKIYESNKLSYFEICATIEQNIRLFQGSKRHQLAVIKWKKDLKYIGDYVLSKL